ncbi:hypothetical protein SDC9_191686 [bioreactor metagenome]|uniref:Uncharacterized protein n=1 Tax=bioreactor metagenome TaxID=1076179 RepID=A0A645HYK4_9ZZZZ
MRLDPCVAPLIGIVAVSSVLAVLKNIGPAHVKALSDNFQNGLDSIVQVVCVVKDLEHVGGKVVHLCAGFPVRIDGGAQSGIAGAGDAGHCLLVKELVVVFSNALGLVQGPVGILVQSLEVLAVLGAQCHPDAAGYLDGPFFALE